MRDQYLRSVLPHGDQAIAGELEKHVLRPMLAILTTYMETRLNKATVPIIRIESEPKNIHLFIFLSVDHLMLKTETIGIG